MSEQKKFSINSVPVTTLILFLICVVITAALVGTRVLTQPKIDELDRRAENEARQTVLPADDYREAAVTFTFEDETVNGAYLEALDASGKVIGYLVKKGYKGYGGEIPVMVGVRADGTIERIKILAADDETPGLGRKVLEKDFYEQYTGKSSGVTMDKNGTGDTAVRSVTSATYSSKAVHRAVSYALALTDAVRSEKTDDEASSETENAQEGEEGTEHE